RRRDPADLPAQPGGGGRVARSARHLLAAGPGKLRGRRRASDEGEVMTRTGATAVSRQVGVNAPQARAFAAFTGRFGDFKPPEHNLLAAPIAETVFEPRAGGHIYDRAVDGSECRWARVLAYEPPSRVLFTWDIGPTWQL